MSVEAAIPIALTSLSLRSIQQVVGATTVQTEVVVETELTHSAPTASTVGSSSAELVAAGTILRDVAIKVPRSADSGICINFGAAATTSTWLIEPGEIHTFRTTQQIRAIRKGSTDVTVYVITAVP